MILNLIEILLFVVAVFKICQNKIEVPLIIILIFSEFISIIRIGVYSSNLFFNHNFFDDGIVLFLLLLARLYFRPHLRNKLPVYDPLKKGAIAFALFFLVGAGVDLLFNNVNFSSIIKVARYWVFLLLLWFQNRMRRQEILRFFRYMLYFCIIYSVYAIVRYFVYDVYTVHARAMIPLTCTTIVFFLLLNNFYNLRSRTLWIFISIIVFHLIVCGGRSLFVIYAAEAFYVFMIQDSRMTLRKFMLLFLFVAAMVGIFTTDNVLSKRLQNTGTEMETDMGQYKITSNLSFRIFLTMERASYLNTKLQYVIFGIGNVQEKDFHHKIFDVGLYSFKDKFDVTGTQVQLDTADTAWPILLLRYGYVGTVIYIFAFFVPVIIIYYRNRHKNGLCASMWVYLVINLLVLSISWASYIAFSYFWIVPLLGLRFADPPVADKNLHKIKRRRARRGHIASTHIEQIDFDKDDHDTVHVPIPSGPLQQNSLS